MNTMTLNPVTPKHFTKGSGKKIAAALTEHGWSFQYNVLYSGGSAQVTATASLTDGSTYTLTATVGENGAFYGASLTDCWSRRQSLATVTDTVFACVVPKQEQNRRDLAADKEARKRARDERAATCEAEYVVIDSNSRQRAVLIAEGVIDRTLDMRHGLSFVASQASRIMEAEYRKQYAQQILACEGKYDDENDRCFTFTEAVRKVLLSAINSMDATGRDTAHAHAEALKSISRWL